jgi:hypothetical protein
MARTLKGQVSDRCCSAPRRSTVPTPQHAAEARLNQWPQFRAKVGGLKIHYIHVRGKGPKPGKRIRNRKGRGPKGKGPT